MSETTQTAMYYNGNWYGRSGNTDALDARITQTANNIAPRQISDTASKLIAVGEYFTDKLGRLCVCDVQIASGGSIVVGSNCHVVSEGLGNELNSNSFSDVVDISSYTSESNPFIVPRDGFVFLRCDTTSDMIKCYGKGQASTTNLYFAIGRLPQGAFTSAFVKKGMELAVTGSSGVVRYLPFS